MNEDKRECRIIWFVCCALSEMCAAVPEKIVDLLTGYLWDEEEAVEIKSNKGE